MATAPTLAPPRSPRGRTARGGNFELNSWLFMRGSGLLLLVLEPAPHDVHLILGLGQRDAWL